MTPPTEHACPGCSANYPASIVVCIECGIDLRTGQTLTLENPTTPETTEQLGILSNIRSTIDTWCEDRHWPGRLIILLWMIYIAVGQFAYHQIPYPYGSPAISFLQNPTSLLDMTIHEMGHAFFMSLGFIGLYNQFLSAIGGTLFQLGLPLLAISMFYRQRDFFAIAFGTLWLAANLYYVQWYISDSRTEAQPILMFWGEDVVHYHDWNLILGRLGLLEYDLAIGTIIRVLAFLVMWLAIAAAAYMVARMIYSSHIENRAK